MLTRIVHNSPKLCTFFDLLDLDLSKPQRQYLLILAVALLVCEDEKTLAVLQRQIIQALNVSNMPISAHQSMEGSRCASCASLLSGDWAVAQAERPGLPKILYINIDHSLGKKDRDTRYMEPVDCFHDHVESTKTKPVFKNAFCYLEANLRFGNIVVTIGL